MPTSPPKPASRGAPLGSRNAAKGDEPRDTPLSARLPASVVARYKSAAESAHLSLADYLIKRAPKS
jgi:hypothetical protein